MTKKLTTAEFIEKSVGIHGDFYDYFLTDYKTGDEKVIITCPIHSNFEQIGEVHLRGSGCPKCSYEQRWENRIMKNKETFEERAVKIHGTKYDYSKVEYIKSTIPVKIYCNKHCEYFDQNPRDHLLGRGCNKCSYESVGNANRSNSKLVLEKFNKIHNNFYDYKNVEYIDTHTKVNIICPIHNEFSITPNAHLRGQGCSKCGNIRVSKYNAENPHGWSHTSWKFSAEKSINFDSYKVYVIECWNDEERFIKIGKTYRTLKKRFFNKREMPYNYSLIKEITHEDAKTICLLEKFLQSNYKEDKYIPFIYFAGREECFNILIKDKILNEEINTG